MAAATKRPNVLWLMSDQHNANCAGYAGHPLVKTPALDKIAERGVNFTNGFANNPICSPSRICFMNGQYMHHHRMFGNDHSDIQTPNPDSMASLFRRWGYQTGLFGKSHMVRRWDEEGFESIAYTDLCDADDDDPRTTHYFNYLVEHGLADHYEEGSEKKGMDHCKDGSAPATLPYEHSIERFTGNKTMEFLENRDASRPFFVHMSFQRPHAPIAPAPEFFNMYNPDDIELPESAKDLFENGFAGKPVFMLEHIKQNREYPICDGDEKRLKRCLASYYALITCIDSEILRVLEHLEKTGELENTIVFYTADHGDFAGEHGLFHKNFGIYESIQRIPYLLSYPGGPRGVTRDGIVESVDLYPTLCELCQIPTPAGRDGISLVPVMEGNAPGKDAAYCEWDCFSNRKKICAVRTKDFRLVFYGKNMIGELYDRRTDPGEIHNLWNDPAYAEVQKELTENLFDFVMDYEAETDVAFDIARAKKKPYCFTKLLHKNRRYYSQLMKTYHEETTWPPARA